MRNTWLTALFDIQIAPPLCWRASRNESVGGTIFERSKLNLDPLTCRTCRCCIMRRAPSTTRGKIRGRKQGALREPPAPPPPINPRRASPVQVDPFRPRILHFLIKKNGGIQRRTGPYAEASAAGCREELE